MVHIREDEDSADSSASTNLTYAADSTTGSMHHSVGGSVGGAEQRGRLLCRQKLHKRLFVGHYTERRHVEQISAYRDVVEIHKSEFDFKKDLDTIKRQLETLFVAVWIGITGPRLVGSPAGHAVWVKLNDVGFGQYWFQIRHVKFAEREILLQVKVVRPLDIFAPETNEALTHQPASRTNQQPARADPTPTAATAAANTAVPQGNNADNVWMDAVPTLEEGTEALRKWAALGLERSLRLSAALVTLHNVKEVFRFAVAFVVAVAVGLAHSVRFTGDFSLKFMHETSHFVHASTPIVLGVIDFFTKMVGGLYILLAMMWRGSGTQPPRPDYPQSYPPALTMGSQFGSSDWSHRRRPQQHQYYPE